MLNYHLHVFGRVQGVGFRWFTHELAVEKGLVGQVKNENDGSVTIDVQGPATVVKQFVKAVQAGPSPYAKVTDVHVSMQPIDASLHDFKMF